MAINSNAMIQESYFGNTALLCRLSNWITIFHKDCNNVCILSIDLFIELGEVKQYTKTPLSVQYFLGMA